MSSVIEPLLEGAEVSHNRGIADDELRMLISRFRTPFTQVYKRWKHAKNPAHYPMLLAMAPDPRSLAVRFRTRFQRLKSPVRASISLLPANPPF
jgi:hypothetical protein